MTKPATIKLPDGSTLVPVVLLVAESDGRGPRVFRRLHDDETIDVEDNMAFWIVYANEASVKERPM